MIIFSDCLTNKVDEGCIKVANSLAYRLKKRDPNTYFVSYKRKSDKADFHFANPNKFFLDRKMIRKLKELPGDILHIPKSSNSVAGVVRIFVLSKLVGKNIYVVFSQRHPMNAVTRWLLQKSDVRIIALSKDSYLFFSKVVGDKVLYLQTGVDTAKFTPASREKIQEIRRKYNIADDKKVALHVGHLKAGRNVDKLAGISDDYHVILVVSAETASEHDLEIRDMLLKRPNTSIVDYYVDNIEEIYQMTDVYVFPVMASGNCIDVPLSVLEAAACNVPVVCTPYAELKEFKGMPGFKFIDSDDPETINNAIQAVLMRENIDNRSCVMAYDWDYSFEKFAAFME